MTNYVADQLATLHTALKGAGWTQPSKGHWRQSVWTLTTGYMCGEATLKLERDKQPPHRSTGSQRYYRGAQPVEWAKTQAHPVLRKIFEQGLDNQTEPE